MQAGEHLARMGQSYRNVVAPVPAVSYIAAWSPDAPFIYMSPQIEAILGFPAERWVKEPELWSERLHPDDRKAVLEAECSTYEEVRAYDRAFRMLAADGSVIWIWERDRIVFDDEDRPLHTEGVMVDITSVKMAESRLHHAESALRDERDLAKR